MGIIRDGFASPVIRVYYRLPDTANGKPRYGLLGSSDTRDADINRKYIATGISYTSTENEGDECKVTIETTDYAVLDRTFCMPGAEIKVSWGYIEGATSPVKYLRVKKVMPSYNHGGVSVELVCVDRASELRESKSKEVHEAASGNAEDTFNAWDLIARICKKKGLVFRFMGRTYDFREIDQTKSNKPVDQNKSLLENIKELGGTPDDPIDSKVKRGGVVYKQYPQANKSDYLLILELLTQQSGGPYVAKTTDNTLEVYKRDLAKKPTYSYVWAGGNGELTELSATIDDEVAFIASSNIQGDFSNPEDKSYTSANTNPIVSGDVSLGEQQKVYPWYGPVGEYVLENAPGNIARSAASIALYRLFASEAAAAALSVGWKEMIAAGIFGFTTGPTLLIGLGLWAIGKVTGYDDKIEGALSDVLSAFGTPQQSNSTGQVYDPKFLSIPAARDQFSGLRRANIPASFLSSPNLGIPQQWDSQRRDLADILKTNLQGIDYSFQKHIHTAEVEPEPFKNVIDNYQKEKSLEPLKFNITAVGNPRIFSGTIINLGGIGKLYSGNYYVAKVTHEVSGNSEYKITLEIKRNAVGDSPTADKTEKDLSIIKVAKRATANYHKADERDEYSGTSVTLIRSRKVNVQKPEETTGEEMNRGKTLPTLPAANPLSAINNFMGIPILNPPPSSDPDNR